MEGSLCKQGSYTFSEMKLPSRGHSRLPVRLYFNKLMPRQRSEIPHSHVAVEMDRFSGDCHGTYVIGAKRYSIEPGDIFLLRSNEQHSIVSLRKGESQSICTGLQFAPDLIWSPSNDLSDLPSVFTVFVDASLPFEHKLNGELKKQVDQEFSDIVREFEERGEGYSVVVKMKLLTILVRVARQTIRNGNLVSGDRIQDYKRVSIEKTLNYIDDHYLEHLTLAGISRNVNMSPSYLEQLFKTLNGFTMWDYILTKRVSDAEKYLVSTDLRVLDISMKCGFASLTYFNRVFKRITGFTPKDYRTKIRM